MKEEQIIDEVNDSSFEDLVVFSNGLTLVAFVTSWCGHCKSFRPVLNELKEAIPYITYFLCDIDKSPDSSRYYDVKSMPSTILFLNGLEIGHAEGYRDIDDMIKFVDNAFKKATSFSRKHNR